MAPTEQQVVHVTGSGQDYHEALKIATAPVVAPQEGEVLVRVVLRPINPVRSARGYANQGCIRYHAVSFEAALPLPSMRCMHATDNTRFRHVP